MSLQGTVFGAFLECQNINKGCNDIEDTNKVTLGGEKKGCEKHNSEILYLEQQLSNFTKRTTDAFAWT